MLKRIQNLYLAISTILVGSLFFCNICTAVSPQGEVAIGLYEKTPYLIFNIMVFTATILALLSYKVRMLQMRVTIISALLLIGFQIWLGVDFVKYQIIDGTMLYKLPSIFPIIAAILNIMAAHNTFKDESIARSMYIIENLEKQKKSKKK